MKMEYIIKRNDVRLTVVDFLIALSLITLNVITMNLPPDYFTFFNLLSLVIFFYSDDNENWLQASASILHIGFFGYLFSILLNKVQ